MSALKSCPHCESLNPSSVMLCLNCDGTLTEGPKPSSLTSRILKTAGVVAMSMTLTACYGGGDMGIDCIDEDADGYCQGEDCNDLDETQNVSCDQGPDNMDVME